MAVRWIGNRRRDRRHHPRRQPRPRRVSGVPHSCPKRRDRDLGAARGQTLRMPATCVYKRDRGSRVVRGRFPRNCLPCRRSWVRVPSSAPKPPVNRGFCLPAWRRVLDFVPVLSRDLPAEAGPPRGSSSSSCPARGSRSSTLASLRRSAARRSSAVSRTRIALRVRVSRRRTRFRVSGAAAQRVARARPHDRNLTQNPRLPGRRRDRAAARRRERGGSAALRPRNGEVSAGARLDHIAGYRLAVEPRRLFHGDLTVHEPTVAAQTDGADRRDMSE
jgi:hypothetical protein